MSEVTSRYQYYAQGIEVTINGRLGAEPEIKKIGDYRVMKLSIAYDAGSKKDPETGEWKNISEWASLNIWENNPGADRLFRAVEDIDSKLKFGKGYSVKFSGRVVITGTVSGERAFINYDVKTLYELVKVYTGQTVNNQENNNGGSNGYTPIDKVPSSAIPF